MFRGAFRNPVTDAVATPKGVPKRQEPKGYLLYDQFATARERK